MKTIILFDLDGTLIDSTEAIVGTFKYSFKKMKFNFIGSDEDIKSLIGYPLDIMYERLGINKDKIQKFVDIYKERYRQISHTQTYILKDAIKSLQLASSFARLGIVTTKTTKYTIPLLESMDILKYFETIIGRQDVINLKPHPEPIYKAIQMMNIDINRYNIYMIGDTKLDLISANKAGINSIGVLCGYGKYDDLVKYTNNIYETTYKAIKYLSNKIN